jgi:hypothetical protein
VNVEDTVKNAAPVPAARPRDARGRLISTKKPSAVATRRVFVPTPEPSTIVVHTTPAGVPLDVLPDGATCVAASPQSGHRYFPCGAPAVALNELLSDNHTRETRCFAHALVGVKEYGERILVTAHPTLIALRNATTG